MIAGPCLKYVGSIKGKIKILCLNNDGLVIVNRNSNARNSRVELHPPLLPISA